MAVRKAALERWALTKETNEVHRVEVAAVWLNISPRTIWRHLRRHKADFPAVYRWTNLRGVKGYGRSHPTHRYKLRVLAEWEVALIQRQRGADPRAGRRAWDLVQAFSFKPNSRGHGR